MSLTNNSNNNTLTIPDNKKTKTRAGVSIPLASLKSLSLSGRIYLKSIIVQPAADLAAVV